MYSSFLLVGGGGIRLVEENTKPTQSKNDNRRRYGILENIHDPVNNDLYKTLNAKDNGITNINKIYSKGKQTSSVKVTFNTTVAPTKIIAGFYMEVKPCKITLTRCNNCQVHGHR